ncbi:MAG: regulatory protein RecX [Clostridia bacterium]|nr:regulatory protein RecX [Clostridia bacterium]
MIVTAIEPRRKSFSAIFIDGEYALKLDTETVITEKLKIGEEIDDERLHELIKASDTKRAKEKALWLISYRDHSEGELRQKLLRDFGEEAADKAIERLCELGLINDEDFARKYAESLSHKHMSQRQIEQKLRQKGLDKELTSEALENLNLDEKEEIRALINKKYLRKLSDEGDLRRTIAALQRRGFGYSDIRSVIEEFTEFEEY